MAPPSSDCVCPSDASNQETVFLVGPVSPAVGMKSPAFSTSTSSSATLHDACTDYRGLATQQQDETPVDCHTAQAPENDPEEHVSRAEAQRLVVLLAAMFASPESSENAAPAAQEPGFGNEWQGFVGGSMLFGNVPLRSPIVPAMWAQPSSAMSHSWQQFVPQSVADLRRDGRRVRISEEAPQVRHIEVTVAEWRSKQAAWRQIARDVPQNQREAAEERQSRWLVVEAAEASTEQPQAATQSPVIRASKCCEVVEIFPEES